MDDRSVFVAFDLMWTIVGRTRVSIQTYNRRLGDLLRSKLFLRTQVLAIIIAQMIIRTDGQGFDPSVDQKFGQDRLDLCLTRFEIVTTDKTLKTFRKLDTTWDESVLRRSVDVRYSFQDGCNSENGWRRYFWVGLANCFEQIVGGIVDPWNDICVSFRVGCPENDYLVKFVVGSEFSNVSSKMIEVSLFVVARNQVVRTISLIGSDEIRVCRFNRSARLTLD